VSPEKWLEARRQFLRKEKAFTRLRCRLSRERGSLPWERVDKTYAFEGPDGKETLAQLFLGGRQLVVYHFMFAPEWEAGCRHCSFWADNFDDQVIHLAHRDVTMIVVSRAPYRKLAAYTQRMGWQFKWLSSAGNDFNFEYEVSFRPGARPVQFQENPRSERHGPARGQRLHQRAGRRGVPYLIDVRSRTRHTEHRLPLPRSRAQGSRRSRPRFPDVLGAAPR
jgi:predicted dithiol-disulfide oxidoreductase (DUF899 family)